MRSKTLSSILLNFLFLCLSFFSISCRKESKIDTEFYIPVEKSNLFVRIVGNADKPLIIDLHGGPGAFSGFDHESYGKYLEDNYLIAYLDQRGGGKSEICNDSTMLTVSQFVKDLDVVVDTLKHKYKGKAVNLLGSSWGGTYGLLYLISHQEKINSFVCTSGKANSIYQYMALIEHERKLAKVLLEKSDNPIKKQRLREILSKLSEIEHSGFEKFFVNMNLIKSTFPKELGFNAYWANLKAQEEAIKMGKDSAVYVRAHYTKADFNAALQKMEFVNRVFRNTPSYNNLNILDEIAVIKTPVLVVQGQYDYNIGLKQADLIYEALINVPKDKKELHIIPNAAHNLNMEAPDLYFNIVKSFLGKYNP
ncbi:MAG: alpha/beta hydrolase [Bacteroidota bacterium]